MSTLTIAPTARKLGRKAVVSPVGLELAEGLSFEAWIDVGRKILGAQDTSRWWLADWLFYGETEYGRKYREALSVTGLEYQTLADLKYVAGAIDFSRRRENLSLAHHREVAALSPDEQDRWLDRAEAEGWSRHALREHVRASTPAGLVTTTRDIIPRGKGESRVLVHIRRFAWRVPEERASRWEQAAEQAGVPFDEWAADALDRAAA